MKLSYKFLVLILIVVSSFLGGVLSNLCISHYASASPAAKDIAAHSIRLVDQAGNTRGGLVFDNGLPCLFFNDEKLKTRAYMGVGRKSSMLVFKDANGKMRLFVEAAAEGSSSIGLLKGNKKPRLLLSYFPHKGPAVGMFDENNVARVVAQVNRGNPSVALSNEDKKPVIAMTSKKGKGALLALWNNNHDPGISLGLVNNQPTFFMYQQPRTGLLFNLAGGRPALALMNNGTPVWSATGDIPAAPDMPLTDDLMRELLR